MSFPGYQLPPLRDVLGNDPLGNVKLDLGTALNPELYRDKAGFFSSLLSAATKEQIGMTPDRDVSAYRAENPIRGFTSQVLPELAYFGLTGPGTKLGALAVRTIKPVATMVHYGEELAKTRRFLGGATQFAGHYTPLFAGRQAASLLAPEEGSFERAFERNLTDIVFGGAFAGTAEFLKGWRGARQPTLAMGRTEPYRSLVTVHEHFPKGPNGIDLNNPPQDQLSTLLRIADDPANAASPYMPDVIRAAGLMRAQVLTEVSKGRPYVSGLGSRKSNSLLNLMFRQGKFLHEVGPEFGVANVLPKNFEAFSKHPRALAVEDQATKVKVWNNLMSNMERADSNTFIAQEQSEGLFVVAKKVHGAEAGANRLFTGTNIPDRYILLKTSKPWEFVEGGRGSKILEDSFVHSPRYREISDNGFLDSPPKIAGSKIIQLGEAKASVLPGNTPIDDAIARRIELANPWQKGMYGVAEATDQLETPAFLARMAARLSQTWPLPVPLSSLTPQAVKEFSRETGFIIRDYARASRQILSPEISQFSLNARAQVLSQLTTQSFHDMSARVHTLLWGGLDTSVLAKGLPTDVWKSDKFWKNALLRLHDVRKGGILTKVVQALSGHDDRRVALSTAWRMGWSPQEAAKNGAGKEVVDLLEEIRKYDVQLWTELKATRAKLGIEDDFVPMDYHYSLSRMWEGDFRVELFDDLTGEMVGMAGGRTADAALSRANAIADVVNSESATAAGRKMIRTPIREHLSTTSFIRYNEEVDREFSKLSKEVDAIQRGSKLSANNFLIKKVIEATQKLYLSDPGRFLKRGAAEGLPEGGAIGFTGQFEPLTLKEILQTLTGNTLETARIVTRESLIARLHPQLAKLAGEYPDLYKQYVIRFNSFMGLTGPKAKEIDSIIDGAFAATLGPHAATRISRQMNRAMFALSFNGGDVGFVAVNAMTGIQTMLPEAAKLMTVPPARLAKDYGIALVNTKRGPQPVHFFDAARVAWRGFKDLKNASAGKDPELFDDLVRARSDGTISKPIIAELHEFGQEAEQAMRSGNPIEAIIRFNERLIGRTEEFSRAWAFVTGRRIAREYLNQTPDQAYETARRYVSRTMYEYTAGDRPRIMTGGVGSGWGLFKNWTAHYMSNLASYGNEAVWKDNWSPLIWAMIGTGTVGGISAVPLYGAANTISEMMTKKDVTDWVYDTASYGGEFGEFTADAFVYGFPSILGITLQGRASAPTSEILRDATLFTNMAVFDRAAGLYNTLGAVWDQVQDGNMLPLEDKRVQRGMMQAFAPRTLQRAYTYWGHEGLDSLRTGNRLINKVSKADAMLHMMGLTPLEVERSFDMLGKAHQDMNTMRSTIQFLGESYAQAWSAGDYRAMSDIHTRAHRDQVPIESVLRSASSRIQKENDDALERQFDQIIVNRIRRSRGG